MRTLARTGNANRAASDEVQKLREVLDKSYAQLRERARMEWRRRCAEADPSDVCVHVRIGWPPATRARSLEKPSRACPR